MPPQARAADSKPQSISGVDARRALVAQESKKIKIRLAHPLNEGNPFTKDGEPAEVGTEIEMTVAQARGLIATGYAAVDAEDNEAVAAALGLADTDTAADAPGAPTAPGAPAGG